MSKKVTLKNLKKNIGKCVRTSSGSLLKLFTTATTEGTPTIVWLEKNEEDHGWPIVHSDDFIGAENFTNKKNRAFYIHDLEDFEFIFGDEPAYYVDEEPKIKKIFANTLSAEEIVDRLQNGEELKIHNRTLKMIKGVLCCKRPDSMQINAGISIDCENDYYFEEEAYEEPFKITEVGFYKTREGSKVYVSMIDPAFKFGVFGVFEGFSKMHNWKENGKFFGDGTNSKDDIVSKWEE